MLNPRNKWTKFIAIALLLVISGTGCSNRGATPQPAPKPIIHGAATPKAAILGFLGAVRDGDTKQALAYWEFPAKGTQVYKHARPAVAWEHSQVIRQARMHRVSWLDRRLPANLKLRRDAPVMLLTHRGVHTESLKAAEWADVDFAIILLPPYVGSGYSYMVHKSGGRWRLISEAELIGN